MIGSTNREQVMSKRTLRLHASLHVRVLVCGVAFVACGLAPSTGNTVALSEDGRGQVLLFPYYAARDGFDTLISVVNTRSAPKAVKLSFYEG